MKIESIEISVFEIPMYPATTQVIEAESTPETRWRRAFPSGGPVPVHEIRVITDEGMEGVCTVRDRRYTEMSWQQIAQLRDLATGENPIDRETLYSKLSIPSGRSTVKGQANFHSLGAAATSVNDFERSRKM